MNGDDTRLTLQESAAPLELIPGHGLWPWWLAAGIIVLLGAAVCIYLKMRKPAAVKIAALRNSAFRDACTSLRECSALDARDAAVQTSMVLRKYLSIAAADPALYETHEEFISRRDALEALTADARAAAETGFTSLATLKYAPEIPGKSATEVIAESRALLETLHQGFAK